VQAKRQPRLLDERGERGIDVHLRTMHV
jgi:hypothetical protein